MNSFLKLFLAVLLLPIAIIHLTTFLWNKILYDEIPNLICLENNLIFDYIIVGAGTAGSVVAAELARKSNASILLVEAGHTFGLFSKIPLLATLAQKTENDWAFLSSSQKHSSKGLIDQKQSLPQGKGLGGSSQLNYLLHFNGKKEDMEKWEEYGATGWSLDAIKPYLNQNKSRVYKGNKENCKKTSSNGDFCYIPPETYENTIQDNIIEITANYSKITEAFQKASKEFKHFNLHRSQYNVKNGLRWNVYEEYLRPSFQQTNLKILTKTLVTKIVIDEFSAKSILVTSTMNGISKIFEISARKEIILSAGAFHTPQLLQLSGIGPKDDLNNLGINVLVDSPYVGKNLYDHMNTPIYVTINESASLTVDKILNVMEIWKYFRTGEGYFGNFGVIGQITSKNDTFGVSIFAAGAIDEATFIPLSNFKQKIFRSIFPFYYNGSQEGLVLLTTCLQPSSRGVVRLKSKNIEDLPIVDPNYLSNSTDIECMIKAIRVAIEIISSNSFKSLKPIVYWAKFKECSKYGPFPEDFVTNYPSDRYLECIIRTTALTSYHPGGTCSIGDYSKGVVDHNLRVKGLKGLRVVDASIMPTPVSGTPNSILKAMAKRAVDIILRN